MSRNGFGGGGGGNAGGGEFAADLDLSILGVITWIWAAEAPKSTTCRW